MHTIIAERRLFSLINEDPYIGLITCLVMPRLPLIDIVRKYQV